jgi:hypothetical protein
MPNLANTRFGDAFINALILILNPQFALVRHESDIAQASVGLNNEMLQDHRWNLPVPKNSLAVAVACF